MHLPNGADIVDISRKPIVTRYAVQQYADAYLHGNDTAIPPLLDNIHELVDVPSGTVVTLEVVTGDPIEVYLHGIQKITHIAKVTL